MATANNSQGPNALSMAGILYKSLSTMSAYDMQMMLNFLKFFQEQATAQVAMLKSYLTTAIASAKEAASATQFEAIGALVGGVVGLAGVGISAYSLASSGDPEANQNLQEAKNFKAALNEETTAEIQLRNPNPADPANTLRTSWETDEAALTKAIKVHANNGNFAPDDVDGTTDALNEAKLNDRAKLNEKLDALIEKYQKAASAPIEGVQFKIQNFYTPTTTAVSNIAQSGPGFAKAGENQASQADQASAGVLDKLVSQWAGNMSNAQQSANQFAQDAAATAAAFGQTVQVHA